MMMDHVMVVLCHVTVAVSHVMSHVMVATVTVAVVVVVVVKGRKTVAVRSDSIRINNDCNLWIPRGSRPLSPIPSRGIGGGVPIPRFPDCKNFVK